MRSRYLLLVASLAAMACSPAPNAGTSTGTAADEAQIRAMAPAYATAFSTGSSKPVAAILADDYQGVEPNGTHLKSAKEAVESIDKDIAQMPKDMKMAMSATTDYVRFLSDKAAVAGGTYKMEGGMAGMPNRGSWMGVAVKTDSTWKMVASLGSDDNSEMMAAAMAKMAPPVVPTKPKP